MCADPCMKESTTMHDKKIDNSHMRADPCTVHERTPTPESAFVSFSYSNSSDMYVYVYMCMYMYMCMYITK